ncbi:MAG: type II toxin-antitoxin system RelE/ParE family toxin [Sporichthyaceae bacterium]
MTGHRLVFHPDVEGDLTAILDYYGSRDPALPARFRLRPAEQFDRLESFPESGAVLFDSYCRVILKRFPYLVVYLLEADQILVLAVVSYRRNPAWVQDDDLMNNAGERAERLELAQRLARALEVPKQSRRLVKVVDDCGGWFDHARRPVVAFMSRDGIRGHRHSACERGPARDAQLVGNGVDFALARRDRFALESCT